MRLGISDLWQYITEVILAFGIWNLEFGRYDIGLCCGPFGQTCSSLSAETTCAGWNRRIKSPFYFCFGRTNLNWLRKNCLTPSHGYAFDPAYGGITISRTVSNVAQFCAVQEQQNKITKNNESPCAWKSTSFCVCNRFCSQVQRYSKWLSGF